MLVQRKRKKMMNLIDYELDSDSDSDNFAE